jgi:hypothetical protein
MPGVLKGIRYEDPLVIYRGEKVLDIAHKLSKGTVKADLDLAIDIYYSMYLPLPILAPHNAVPQNKVKNYLLINELLKILRILRGIHWLTHS